MNFNVPLAWVLITSDGSLATCTCIRHRRRVDPVPVVLRVLLRTEPVDGVGAVLSGLSDLGHDEPLLVRTVHTCQLCL